MTTMAAALTEAGLVRKTTRKPSNHFNIGLEVKRILDNPDNYKCGHLTDSQALAVFKKAYGVKA